MVSRVVSMSATSAAVCGSDTDRDPLSSVPGRPVAAAAAAAAAVAVVVAVTAGAWSTSGIGRSAINDVYGGALQLVPCSSPGLGPAGIGRRCGGARQAHARARRDGSRVRMKVSTFGGGVEAGPSGKGRRQGRLRDRGVDVANTAHHHRRPTRLAKATLTPCSGPRHRPRASPSSPAMEVV